MFYNFLHNYHTCNDGLIDDRKYWGPILFVFVLMSKYVYV